MVQDLFLLDAFEMVPPDNNVDFFGEVREVVGFGERTVAAADDGDCFIFKSKAVARSAGEDLLEEVVGLSGDLSEFGRGAQGYNASPGFNLLDRLVDEIFSCHDERSF